MILARAPLRISFAGGGTDIPQFYKTHESGAVVATSITRYVYVTVNDKFDWKVSVRYRNHEAVNRVEDLKHVLIRETLLDYGIRENIEIVVSSDVPARGSGLGASSALTVALCAALDRFVGSNPEKTTAWNPETIEGKKYLAERASDIEINKVSSPIGKQDHYASAIGGFNYLKFNSNDSVEIHRFDETDFIRQVEAQSMLFYLNCEHMYVKKGYVLPDRAFVPRILSEQITSMPKMIGSYVLQRDNAMRLRENMDYEVIERFMDHVNENWRIKKSLHADISNHKIEKFMARAIRAGASAAKVCGAGGGGFGYLLVQPDMQESVRMELGKEFQELHFGFDWEGVKILYDGYGNRAVRQTVESL